MTPSSWHGVTSVVMGNCGVGIAPCKPETREIAMKDLVNVEGIPFDVLNKGITWDWETFPEFMDAAAARKPSLNLAFIAPLTPFRHYVMGEASMERAATPEETHEIARLIGEAMDAGALGFSSTTLNQHLGFEGKPLACRNASREEMKAYANELKKRGKGAIEIALTRQVGVLEQDQCELLDFLLEESGRPVTFIALFDRDDIPEAVRDTLRRAAPMIAKGARPQTSPLPLTRECNMDNPFAFAAFPAWKRVFADTSKEAQKKVYADPAFRTQFTARPQEPDRLQRLAPHRRPRRAQSGAEAPGAQVDRPDRARSRARTASTPSSTWCWPTISTLELTISSWNTREDRMRELLNNPAILMALGDGGAHVDMLCDAGYPTYLLGTWVREKQAITLEEGVRKLTSDPADLFGLKDRGRLAEGRARRRRDLRSRRHRLQQPRRTPPRPARRRQAHRHAVAGRRIHGGQRRADLGTGQADRREGRQGVAGSESLLRNVRIAVIVLLHTLGVRRTRCITKLGGDGSGSRTHGVYGERSLRRRAYPMLRMGSRALPIPRLEQSRSISGEDALHDGRVRQWALRKAPRRQLSNLRHTTQRLPPCYHCGRRVVGAVTIATTEEQGGQWTSSTFSQAERVPAGRGTGRPFPALSSPRRISPEAETWIADMKLERQRSAGLCLKGVENA